MSKKDICTECGSELVESLIPACGYQDLGIFFNPYATRVFTKFNEEGELQMLKLFSCPNKYKKPRWQFWVRDNHTEYFRKIESFNYYSEYIY